MMQMVGWAVEVGVCDGTQHAVELPNEAISRFLSVDHVPHVLYFSFWSVCCSAYILGRHSFPNPSCRKGEDKNSDIASSC